MKSLRWQGAPPPDNDALSHAVAMVLFIVLAGLMGAWIDSIAGTGPIFLLVLGAVGAVGAFTSAYYRFCRRSDSRLQGDGVNEGKATARSG